MASSSPSRDACDTEHCDSKAKSTSSPFEGCFLCEDNFSCEDIISLEDTPPKMCPSDNQVPPPRHMLGTDGMKTWVPQRDHNRDDPQWCGRQGITVAWAGDDNFEESTDNENQNNHKGNQANHQDHASDFFELTPVEDFRLCSCSLSPLAQVRCQEDDAYPDSLTCSSPEEEDAPVPETPPLLMDQCCAETANEMTGSQKSGVTGTSRASSVQAEDGDTCPDSQADTCPDSQATTCLKMGRVFRWLKKKILAALHQREDPEKATKSGCLQAPKRRRGLRNNRVVPEEPLQ